ncbi:ABC transporter substrate-binding protein [Paenibacillus cymbidii]|uniref:ABC transporter substrate-binding protein n=1 Tax=Paenibacillus cymbidii TaxID=1639034 RepID=UPI0010809033|nr:iron-siderophore ABC transporter substrate-binding protein [Paenibacillus cymbidii]
MTRIRTVFVSLFAGLIVLAISACGSNNNQAAQGASPAAAIPSASVAPTASPSVQPSASASAAPAKRTITHALGQTEVPAKVSRVASLTPHFADHLVALGITPIASVSREAGDFEPYLAAQLKGTESLGQQSAPSLEKLVTLKPDLILAVEKDHSKAYETLQKTAPTLIFTDKEMEQDWAGVFLKVAAAVGKKDEGKAKLKAFEDRTKALKEKLAAKLGNETVVFFKMTDKDARVLSKNSPLGKIAYEQLGLKAPQGLPDGEGEIKIAIEKLPEMNPDHIFVMDVNVPDYVDKLNEAMKTPIWQSLNAVKNKHVYMVPLRATKTGFGLVMHGLFVDEVQKALLGQ